ncbi:MAG: glycosyltransferase [Firmicutes bacterium HGW-Firmicutes-1]|jgi:N-acetylglucosaminyldiphosphoundecaprenol N-acetyl-beta-D-mannosaminyltransferase|nr:MAG: glycosyltransferase [Firmicutes bacterium HGW-Firmicutes-1]
MKYLNIFNVHVNCTDRKTLLKDIQDMVHKKQASYIAFTNVHVIVTAMKNEQLRKTLNEADRVAPDGMPLVWLGKFLMKSGVERCSGPDIMEEVMKVSNVNGYSHYFYGSTEDTLSRLQQELSIKYPKLKIAGSYSPPFRELSKEEDQIIVNEVNRLSPDFIWVGLGAPKQEIWMKKHKKLINRGVMMGVGAAFDFHAGSIKRAPHWMQKVGFEWLFRLIQEPKRLWKRYFITNLVFLYSLLTKGVKLEEREIL